MRPRRDKTRTLEHPSQEELAAFACGHCSAQAKETVIDHLARCPSCRKLVALVEQSRQAATDPDHGPCHRR